MEFDGRKVVYPFGELDELVLCYATTIHKSQGSEYPVVVIPISTQHYMMLKRNLIYTGITRGKRLVVLVGQKKALAMVVNGKQVERRWSKLRVFSTLGLLKQRPRASMTRVQYMVACFLLLASCFLLVAWSSAMAIEGPL